MKTLNENFAAEKDKRASVPVTLAVFHFASGDVYVSDRVLRAGVDGPEFAGLVTSWGALTAPAHGLFSVALPEVTVELANTGPTPFSSYLESGVPEDTEVELFQWFEGLAYADREPLGRFVISSPVSYSDSSVRLALVSAFIKKNRIVGSPITRDEFPYADTDAVGRTKGIVYGSVKQLPCHPVVAGGMTTLVSDVTASQTTGITLSMSPNETPLPASGTLQACKEKLSYTGITGKTLTGVTRGVSGTAAAAHRKGASIFEVRSDFTYLVAGHPVKSIGDVYVGGVRVASGVTKNTNSSGRATLVFAEKYAVEKAVALSVDQGSHEHRTTGASSEVLGTGGSHYPSSGVNWIGVDGSVCDGSRTGPKLHGDSTSWPAGNYIQANFPAWTGGTIRGVKLCIAYEKYLSTGGKTIKFAGNVLPDTSGVTTLRFTNGTSYPGSVQCVADTFHNGHIDVYEIWLEVEADTLTSAATGVALSGNSTADMVVGGLVTCDVDGYADDASGTYTGSPGGLIDNPADVMRHFMQAHMDVPSEQFGPSFVTARNALAQATPGGYRFAGVIDRPVDALDQLESWAAQSRLKLRHDGTEAGLRFLTNDAASADKTIGRPMVGLGSLKVSRTGREEVVNRLAVHYRLDLTKPGGKPSGYLAVADSSAAYPGAGDTASVSLYGPRTVRKPTLMDFVADDAMASDLRDFYISRFKDAGRRITMSLYLDNIELEEGDVVELDCPSSAMDFSGAMFHVEDVSFRPGSLAAARPDELQLRAREV
ncbi:MAG: hypothetical protein HZC51_01500 [Nitrospirae bacterium]|nr:hypothetical protein [Nitrospirota bacterium]